MAKTSKQSYEIDENRPKKCTNGINNNNNNYNQQQR